MGFKTRFGMGLNPFAEPYAQAPTDRITSMMPSKASAGRNGYFRRILISGL